MTRTKLNSPSLADPAHAPASRLKKRGPAFWAIAGLAAVVGGLWLANFLHRALVFVETDDAYVTGHIYTVSPRLDDSVTEVLVSENQEVKAGQILARLDPLAAEIAQAKARAAIIMRFIIGSPRFPSYGTPRGKGSPIPRTVAIITALPAATVAPSRHRSSCQN